MNASPATPKSPSAHLQPRRPSREIELKFLADETTLEAVRHWPVLLHAVGPKLPQRLCTIYFDTASRDLLQHGMSLRVRQSRNRHVMTFKWKDSGGRFDRGEIEIPVRSPVPDPSLLGEQVVGEIMRATQGQPLQPAFTTDIRRLVRRVRFESSEIEAGFDTGFIVAGERKEAVREIELELKSGCPAELYKLGLSLAGSYPVRLGVLAKSERGLLLTKGDRPTAVYARNALSGEQSLDEAIEIVLLSCIDQFVANWPAFEAGSGPEPVHQMRIGLRRLRSMLSLLQQVFACPAFAVLRNQARRIGSAMEEARNWDVFAGLIDDLIDDGPGGRFSAEAGFGVLLAESRRRRDSGYERVRSLLADPAVTRFVLEVHAFVATRGWRNDLSESELSPPSAEAARFAAQAVERLHDRLRERGQRLADLPAEQQHKVRIELKILQFAVDSFAILFADQAAARSYARAVARLQNTLGGANDMQMAINLARQLVSPGDRAVGRAVDIMLGWCARSISSNRAELKAAWKEFRKAPPFWATTGVARRAAVAVPGGHPIVVD